VQELNRFRKELMRPLATADRAQVA